MSKTIIRAPRRHRYVNIDQTAIEDSRLSWAARGLLGYLLSKPDDWKVLVKDLQRRGNLGRDGTYRLLRELRDTAYVLYEKARDERGRIRGGTYFVREIPSARLPDLPDTASPDTAPPDPVKPETLPNTDQGLRRTTTTTPTTNTKGGGSGCSCFENEAVEIAEWVPSCGSPSEQIVIDEWAGITAAGGINHSPLGYLQTLVARMETGEFTLKYADEVAELRRELKQRSSLESPET